jgi:hypothetical protein
MGSSYEALTLFVQNYFDKAANATPETGGPGILASKCEDGLPTTCRRSTQMKRLLKDLETISTFWLCSNGVIHSDIIY